MLASAALWVSLIGYVGGVVTPRLYWLLAGRRCPHCERGRLSFQGLTENPWRRLRSQWQCLDCRIELQEGAWGRLASVTEAEEARSQEVAVH